MQKINTGLKVVLVALTLFGMAPVAQAQFGVAVGLNYDNLSDIEIGDTEATFDNASGYHVGVFYDLGLGPAAIRVGVFYRDLGDIDVQFPGLISDFDLTVFEIPVDLRFNLGATPVLTPYVIVGPVFSFPSTGNANFSDAFETVMVSGNVGAGLALNLLGVRLFPEVRYTIGVSRFMKQDLSIGNVAFEAVDVQRLNSVMLRIGVGL